MLRATRDGYPTVGLGYLLAGGALIDDWGGTAAGSLQNGHAEGLFHTGADIDVGSGVNLRQGAPEELSARSVSGP